MTNVPAIQWTDQGPVAPAEPDIVAGLGADWNAAFGGDLNTDPTTPTGQIIASTSAMLGDADDQQVALFNMVDPAFATGRMQDAIARIYFLERNPAQSTVLQIACGGAVKLPIPVGALIRDDAGNVFMCNEAGTIPTGGSVTHC
jgi:hypothetical protein